jgi:hypothetical protein
VLFAAILHPELNRRPLWDTIWTTSLHVEVLSTIPRLRLLGNLAEIVEREKKAEQEKTTATSNSDQTEPSNNAHAAVCSNGDAKGPSDIASPSPRVATKLLAAQRGLEALPTGYTNPKSIIASRRTDLSINKHWTKRGSISTGEK